MARSVPGRFNARTVVLVVAETALILLAVAVAVRLRLGDEAPEFWTWDQLGRAGLIALVCQTCLYYAELYDLRVVADRRELLVRLLRALGAASLVLGFAYFWLPDLIIGRGVFLIASGLVMTIVVAWRVLFDWASIKVGPSERLLLVGTGPASVALAREIHERRSELGVEIAGFVDSSASQVGDPVFNPSVIGVIEDIPAIVAREKVDRVVVSLGDARGKLPMDRLLEMKLSGVTFDHLASVYEEYTGKIAIENLRPSWLIFSAGFAKPGALAAAKRIADVALAAVGLVLAAPVMGVVALVVRLTSPGPALYHQTRVGQHNAVFTVHKFRSMRQDAEAKTGAVWATANDHRVTPVGRFLRKVRLDELPQLWNVLVGEMSFVGPRPERPEFVAQLTEQIPFYGLRHAVKPGVTGWAQVCYTYGASVEDALEKLQYDLYYIKNLSMGLDLFVIFKTFQTVILRRGQ
jgi:sugar transferase (PEP-CTERM system associated)